jgi:hypothetical protein
MADKRSMMSKAPSWAQWLLPIGAIAVYLLLAGYLAPFVPDDSYISFRYADHLSQGQGLTYNAAEPPVEGYSNLLWILMCAALGRAELSIAAWAPRIGVGLGVATLLLFWVLLRRRQSPPPVAGFGLLLVATSGPFILYSVSGLETPLCSFLLVLAMFCAERVFGAKRGWLPALAVTCSLFSLCRPEGVLLFPALMGLLLMARNRSYRRCEVLAASGIYVAAMIGYHAWRMSYFGELWPTPFLSKGAGSSLLSTWTTNFRFLFWRQNHDFAPFGYYYGALGLIAGGTVLGIIRRERRMPFEALPAALAALYGLVYLNFVDWMPGMRYAVPLIGLLALALGASNGFVARSIRRPASAGTSARPRRGTIAAAYGLALAIGLSSVAVLGRDGRRNEASTQRCLVELGTWLRVNVPSHTLLAMSDVGATPYYSGLPTIDINPRSLTDRHIAHHGWSDRYFYERDPDLVVLVSFSARRPVFYRVHQRLFDGARFQRSYHLIGVTRYDPSEQRSYWVFASDSIRLSREQMASFPTGLESNPTRELAD